MGFAKRLLEEIEARGSSPIDKHVCAACVEDTALKVVVGESASRSWCDYCGKRRRSVHMDDLMDVVMDGIKSEWDDPVNELGWDSAEGGYLGTTVDKWDLIGDLDITENEQLYDDIVDALVVDVWCRRDYYGLPEHERLAYGWERFCELIKHSNRFFPTIQPRKRPRYPDPDEVSPDELLKSLSDITSELGLVRKLPQGTRFVRARTHKPGVILRTPGELASPPNEKAYMASRMSGAGIPMFYGALDQKTALAEVDYPDSGSAATVATFGTTVPFQVLDLSRLPAVPSIFDVDRRHLRPGIRFMHNFVDDFSKPIARDDRVHVEYAPTQYVTGHIQNMMRGNIKGVIYPSSKVRGGKSCVLFFKNEECREPDGGIYSTAKQYLKLLPPSIRRFAGRVSVSPRRRPSAQAGRRTPSRGTEECLGRTP